MLALFVMAGDKNLAECWVVKEVSLIPWFEWGFWLRFC